MAKIIAETSTKNLFVFLFILNLKIKIIDKLGFDKNQFPKLMKTVYESGFTKANAVKSFERNGLFPFNRGKITLDKKAISSSFNTESPLNLSSEKTPNRSCQVTPSHQGIDSILKSYEKVQMEASADLRRNLI